MITTTRPRIAASTENKGKRSPVSAVPIKNNPNQGQKSWGNGMKNLRILIADDHDVVRRGIKSLIESRPEWVVCDEAHSGREAVAKSEETKAGYCGPRYLDAGTERAGGGPKDTKGVARQ